MGYSYLDYLKSPEAQAATEMILNRDAEATEAEAEQSSMYAARAAERAAECEIQASQAEAGRLKEGLRQCLDAGMPAAYLAMQAMKCVGLLTDDIEYAEHAEEVLRRVYPDIEQQSAFTLDAMEAEYQLDLLVDEFCRTKAAKVSTIQAKAETIAEKARECSVMIESLRRSAGQQ